MTRNQRGTISKDWKFQGFDVIMLENQHLRAAVLPTLGAKIFQLIDKRLDLDLLYHHPRVELRTSHFGSNVDNWWSGGIDDAFPTGHPCVIDGEELPFLGEVWSMAWQWEQVSPCSVKFTRFGVITPFRLSRTMTLNHDDRYLSVNYTLENVGTESFPYLWGIHPAVPIGRRTRIHVPATKGLYGDGTLKIGNSDTKIGSGASISWPFDSVTEISELPSGNWHHLYLTDVRQGWLAVTDDVTGAGFGMTFSLKDFPSVHLWVVDGGWRGIRCAVVEPWSGYPARLDEAIAVGQARVLAPGECVETEVHIIAFDGQETVNGFDNEGRPL